MNKKQVIQIALTLTSAAAITMAGNAATKNHPSKVVPVSPAELPELARVTGQAMALHMTGSGRAFLYVEPKDGTRLAILIGGRNV